MRNRFILLIVSFSFIYTQAQDTRYAAEFLELGVSTKALGMGGANVSLNNDVTGASWNPASIAFIPQLQAASLYANLFNSLEKQSYVGAAIPLFGGTTVSFSWIRLSIDGIDRHSFDPGGFTFRDRYYDEDLWLTRAPEGSFGSSDNAYYISFAKHMDINWDIGWQYWEMPLEMAFGFNIKMIDLSLDNKSGSGVGIDLGYI